MDESLAHPRISWEYHELLWIVLAAGISILLTTSRTRSMPAALGAVRDVHEFGAGRFGRRRVGLPGPGAGNGKLQLHECDDHDDQLAQGAEMWMEGGGGYGFFGLPCHYDF